MRDDEFDRRVADAKRANELSRAAQQSSVSGAEEAARRDWQASLAAARAAVQQLRRHGVLPRPADVELSGGTYRRGMLGGYKVTSSYYERGGTISEYRRPEHWVVPLPGIVRTSEYHGQVGEAVMLTPEAELGFMVENPSKTIRLGPLNRVAVYEFVPLTIAVMTSNGEWWVERRAPWREFGSHVCRVAELPTEIEAGVIALAAGA